MYTNINFKLNELQNLAKNELIGSQITIACVFVWKKMQTWLLLKDMQKLKDVD